MKKNKKRNVSEEVKNGIKDLEQKLTEIEQTMKINTQELREQQKLEEEKNKAVEENNNEKPTLDNEAKEEVVENSKEEELEHTKDLSIELKLEEEKEDDSKEKAEQEAKTMLEEYNEFINKNKDNNLEMPAVEEEKVKEEVKPEKKEEPKKEKIRTKDSNNNAFIIIICVVVSLLLYLLPMVFISLFAYGMDNLKSNYKEIDNSIVVENKIKINELNGFFDERTESYIVSGLVENNDRRYLNVEVEFYDKDDYVIATVEENLYMQKGNKYKLKIRYDGFDAREVVNYKIVNVYCN